MTGADITAAAKKHPIGVVCGLISLICVVLLYLGSDAVDERKTVADERSKTDHAINANVTNSKDLAQQTEEMQHAVKEMESRLIKGSQLAINLQYFYRLESETGVKMADVHQGSIPALRSGGKGGYIPVPFGVNIQGNFKQVLDFMQRVENGPRVARFTSVSFTKTQTEATGPNGFNISMGIEFLGTP
jgi:Tfp pilus assembly protein PilO